MNVLSAAYGRVARARRSWYERHPQSRRHLDRPVISVGNLSVGGSGKTPIVAALARMLLDMGERPAVLSRGYARRRGADGVVVVSDGDGVLEPVERSGDEPQMLARALAGVPVLVSPDRYLAGRLAERRFGCTVMILDDGFQHLMMGRDVDLLVMPAADLDEAMLPAGRLREPLDAACSADCLLVPGSDEDVARVAETFERTPVFKVIDHYAPVKSIDPVALSPRPGSRVVAVAGIARPERFVNALKQQYDVARALTFRDHHWFTAKDLDRIRAAAREANADWIVTTEKDAVRVTSQPGWAVLPLEATIETVGWQAWTRGAFTAGGRADRFESWLRGRV